MAGSDFGVSVGCGDDDAKSIAYLGSSTKAAWATSNAVAESQALYCAVQATDGHNAIAQIDTPLGKFRDEDGPTRSRQALERPTELLQPVGIPPVLAAPSERLRSFRTLRAHSSGLQLDVRRRVMAGRRCEPSAAQPDVSRDLPPGR